VIQRKKEVDGDLFIPGSITVLGGINSSAYRKTVTTLARTEGRVDTVEGTVAILEDAIAEAIPLPPTENVTNILLETTANADGSLHVEITWDYAPEDPETVPTTVIAGCAIVYMFAGINTPPELTTKSVGRIIPMSGAGSYSWSGDFPARQIANDNNTFPIHYRFGIVAANASSGEVKIHADGIIDGGSSWRAIVSGSIISVDNGNFWNLVTGEFMATIGYDQSFHIDPANEEARLVNIPLTSYKGAGVNRTATRLDNDSLDWLDAPDTTPASDELLTARIGRLGVGGSVLLDGEFTTGIDMGWSSPLKIVASSANYISSINTKNGVVRAAYRSNVPSLHEVVFAGSAWSTPVEISTMSPEDIRYLKLANGELWLIFVRVNDTYLYKMVHDGISWSAPAVLISKTVSKPDIIQTSDGTIRLAYRHSAAPWNGKIIEITSSNNGSTWSAEASVDDSNSTMPKYIELHNGLLKIAYCRNSGGQLYEKNYENGSWGTESLVKNANTASPVFIQELNGTLRLSYYDYTTNSVVERVLGDTGWGSEVALVSAAFYPSYIQNDNGALYLFYRDSAGQLSLITLQRYARIGGGFIAKGATDYTLFDGAKITVSGTSLTGYIGPQGPTGATGATGPQGATGTAATIAVGTVTPGEDPEDASVTNSGTSGAAVLDFVLPRGFPGYQYTGQSIIVGTEEPTGGSDGDMWFRQGIGIYIKISGVWEQMSVHATYA